MHLRTLTAVAVLSMFQAIPAQRTQLPVGDLLERDAISFYPRDWIGHIRAPWQDEDETWRGLRGEGQLLADARPKPWFTRDGLVEVVAKLARIDSDLIDIEGGRLEVGLEQHDAVRAALLWVRQHLPPRMTIEVALVRVDGDETTTLLSTARPIVAGSTVTMTDLVTRPILRDFDVEIAQSAAIANPVVDSISLGSCVALRARPVTGTDNALVEVVARVAETGEAPKLEMVHEDFGMIDRAARGIDGVGATFLVPRGVARQHEWTDHRGRRLRLTCKASWPAAVPAPRGDVALQLGGLLNKPVLSFRDVAHRMYDAEGDTFRRVYLAVDAAAQRSRDDVLMQTSSDTAVGSLVLLSPGAGDFQAQVSRVLDRALAPARVEIAISNRASGKDAEGDSVARIAGPLLVGEWASFGGRTEMIYIHDWDTEVAQSARIPDPKIRPLTHGYSLDVRPIAGAGGKIAHVAIQGSIVRLERIDVAKIALDSELRSGGVPDKEGASVSPSIVLPQNRVAVERPILARQPIRGTFPVDANGKVTLRRSATKLFGVGRDLVIEISVVRG